MLFLLIVLTFCVPTYGQSSISSVNNRVEIQTSKYKKSRLNLPLPKRAGTYGLIFPGAGQIYNKKYWKLPIVWGAVGGMVYVSIHNTNQYNRFNTAYGLRVASERNGIAPSDEFVGRLRSSDSIKANRDEFDRNRQIAIIGAVAIYALQALEAYVDAHLQDFDVSDDLSFQPIVSNQSYNPFYLGLGLVFELD